MKIIHCADLHLGSKIDNKLKKISEDRKSEVRNAFSKMVEYANENNVSIILLSGDVFDSDKPYKKDKLFFYSIIEKYPNIDFMYLRGNHDSYEFNNQDYPNLKTFSELWTEYKYDNVSINGIEISNDNCTSFYSTLSLNEDNINIVMLHGQESDSTGMDKIKLSKLRNKNIDYLALGHIHSYQSNKLDSRGIYAYSGCLEGRGFDETGIKGFVLLDVNKEIKHTFIPFSQRKIEELNVNVSEAKSLIDIINKVKDSLKSDYKNIYRINLIGEIDAELSFTENDVKSYLNEYYFIDVKNKTKAKIDLSKYEKDLSLKGEFVRTANACDDITEEQKQKIIALALRLLAGNEVDL